VACRHASCRCEIQGCGLTHPDDWTPVITMSINGHEVGGDDVADCVAHYLISLGYPTDRPDHLRSISEGQAARWPGKG
jgi:hypothetical protein